MNAPGVPARARQRVDGRRRGLLPGLGVRAAHRAPPLGHDGVPRRAQHRPAAGAVRRSASARATFFTLGWIAERYPSLVREIVDARARTGQPRARRTSARASSRRAEFRADVEGARKKLEDIGGVAVRGYRAPSFSIGHGNLWAFDCLAEAGLRLQLEHLSGAARSLRHAGRAALRAPRRRTACSNCRSRRPA